MPANIKISEYPDFMGKSFENSYESKKIIGVMYRKCKEVFSNESYKNDPIEINKSLLIEGYQNYINYAEEFYFYYRDEMEIILKNVDCTQESELFVGICLSSYYTYKQAFKLSISLIQDLWYEIRDIVKKDLNDKFKNVQDKDLLKKQLASAFYYVAYSSKENSYQRIISFAWIFEEYLYKIGFVNIDLFSNNFIDHFIHIKYCDKLITNYVKIMKLCQNLCKFVHRDDSKFIMIGPFGLFLFESDSELNIMSLTNEKMDQNTKTVLRNKFNNHENSINQNNEDVKLVLFDFDEKKLLNFIYFRQMIFKNSILWPILHTIIHFAQIDDLFLDPKNIEFDSYIHHCISYLIGKNYIINIKKEEVTDEYMKLKMKNDLLLFRLDDWYQINKYVDEELRDSKINIGKILIEFYKDNAFEEINLLNNSLDFSTIFLNNETKSLLKNHNFKVLNKLCSCIDIRYIWQSTFKNQRNQKKKIKNNEPIINEIELKNGKKSLFIDESRLCLPANLKNYQQDSIKIMRKNTLYCISKSYSDYSHNFSHECYKEFFHHSINQLYKIVDSSFDSIYNFKLKFGDLYLTTNLESTNEILIYKFNDLLNSSNKRKNIQTIFHSSINQDKQSFFKSYDFVSKTYESYIVYMETPFKGKKFLRVKYDSNLKFMKLEHAPIKWICVDLFGTNKNEKQKNIRFSLDSRELEDVDYEYGYDYDVSYQNLIDSLIDGVLSKRINGLAMKQYIIKYIDKYPFVKHVKSIEYSGDYETNWKKVIESAKIRLPDEFNTSLFNKVKIKINDLYEYSRFDSIFPHTLKRKELIVDMKIESNELNKCNVKDYIDFIWHLAIIFDKILE